MAKHGKHLPRVYGNPLQEGIEQIGLPIPALERESTDEIAFVGLGYIQELAARVKQHCSHAKMTDFEKRKDCSLLVSLVSKATKLVYYLALEFQKPFREIAEALPHFPCLFPAHPETLRGLQRKMWDDFNLGKRCELKLRPAPGRKTFSFETWVNQFLFHYICEAGYRAALNRYGGKASRNSEIDVERLDSELPLIPKNAKHWLDVIWKLLLVDVPNPEKHPRLRQLVERPSLRRKRMRRDGTVGEKTQTHNIRAAIKARLGEYLKRMLNDSAVTQITT